MSVLFETSCGDIVIDLYIQHYTQEVDNFIKLCTVQYYSHLSFFACTPDKRCSIGDPTYSGYGGQSIYSILNDVEPTNPNASIVPTFKPSSSLLTTSPGHTPHVYAEKQIDGSIGSLICLDLGQSTIDYTKMIPIGIIAEGVECVKTITNQEDQSVMVKRIGIIDDPFPSLGVKPSTDFIFPHHVSNREASKTDPTSSSSSTTTTTTTTPTTTTIDATQHIQSSRKPDPHAKPNIQLALESTKKNSIFISNLNPSTSEKDLITLFSRFGRVIRVNVVREKYPPSVQNPPREFLRAYAFLDFSSELECNNAIAGASNVIVDGFKINVDYCHSNRTHNEAGTHHRKRQRL